MAHENEDLKADQRTVIFGVGDVNTSQSVDFEISDLNDGPPQIEVEPDAEQLFEAFVERGITDGLPVIPPTAERVERMLMYTDLEPDAVVGLVPPSHGVATVEKVAVNAVMAGCRPQYFPLILTALKAALDPAANLRAALTTTYVSWPLFVVNGPVRNELEINCGWGVISSGFRANATIGRAMTLTWMNIGGAKPGWTEKKPQGSLLRHTPVIGEFEEESGWEPLHVERGYDAEVSTVTVFADYGIPDFIYGQNFGHPTYELWRFAQGIASPSNHGMAFGGISTEALLLFNPNHSKSLADQGWRKEDVKRFLYENARTPRERVMASVNNEKIPDDIRENTRVLLFNGLPKWAQEQLDSPYITNELIPVVQKPEDFAIVCAGAPVPQGGKLLHFKGHCMGERSVTRPITRSDGEPISSVEELNS